MGPCEVNCPLSYLELVPDPGGYATAWRERVRNYWLRKKLAEAIKPGVVFRMKEPVQFSDGCQWTEFRMLEARKGRYVRVKPEGITGRYYRLSKDTLLNTEWEIVE
jgi:hypothetical protein